MTYQDTLDFLFNSLPMFQRQGKAAYKANLNNSIAFDNYLQHPHKEYKTVHIAGTNGKGSTSHMLSSVLQEAGYKVGLYTSPHLKDFRERIKINGEMISEKFVVTFIEKIQNFIKEFQPSFFEMTVFMAFEYFKVQNIDIAIVETGMGGRLDSTNLILPEISVITNISLDHTQFLGDTLEKIAFEKAGILKESIPVIVGESKPAYDAVFLNRAREKNTSCEFSDRKYKIPYSLKKLNERQVFDIYKNDKKYLEQIELDLLGIYQQKNILTTIHCLDFLQNKLNIEIDHIYKGLKNVIKNTSLLGRWQTLGSNHRIICDTAHNEAGIHLIMEQINQIPYRNLHIVWGMVNDKSIDKIMSMLPKKAQYYFTKAQIPRALDSNKLFEIAQKHQLKGKTYISVKEALAAAKSSANQSDMIFIGGSTFVVAEVV